MRGASGAWILAIQAKREVAAGTWWLEFDRPPDVPCDPGHFFMLSPATPSGSVFLGRPFSIGDERAGRWRFLLRALGRGTAWLGGLDPGAALRVVGPLGRPFESRDASAHRIVAGGIGLAPFFYLARRLRAERPGARIELLYGERSRTAHAALDDEEASLFDRIERATDDGSQGRKGTVLELLAGRWTDPGVAWYACGPQPMLRALAYGLLENGVQGAQFSLEERMGCGFGVCQACIVPRPPRNGRSPRYRLLCTEGPVVDPRAVDW
ncbi:MAG TPA: hypothetical protein VM737_12370 [Gemmatimonadota bacterium]|nr:hypothetical protein [Gemmatimonadota bacterium]